MENLLKGNKISLVACGLLISFSMAFGANNIDSAIKEGKVSGSLALFNSSHTIKDNDDSAFTTGALTLSLETAEVNGFSAKAGFIGVHVFNEKNDIDADEDIAAKSLMTEAYGKYENDYISMTAGRQEVDLEWMGDYHEAVMMSVVVIPETTLTLGYSDRIAVAGVDEISESFSNDWDGNGEKDKGAYVLDAKYKGLNYFEFNPYAYSLPDLANWYGLKTTFTTDMFGAVAHHAKSDVDSEYFTTNNINDGSISHFEINTTVDNFSEVFTVATGYIKTDKNGVSGIMDNIGDNISPFDNGDKIYGADAKTLYGSLGYTLLGVELGALYGETTYSEDNFKEIELNLTVGYSFTDALSTSILYANVNSDSADLNTDPDDKYILATVEYSF